MSQIHIVVCYDTETNSVDVDWETTGAKFNGEVIFRPEKEEWDTPSAEEDEILDELIPQLDNHLSHFTLDK